MKKILTFLVFLMVLTCAFSVFAEYPTVEVYVNDELLVSDSPAILVSSRTMVPLRAISEKLGCQVGWDAETQTAEIKNDKTAVYVTIDSDVMVKKSVAEEKTEEIKIDAPAMLYKSRTLIPLRAVSEALDAKVDWDAEKECALITTNSFQAYYGVVTENEYVSKELGIKFVAPENVALGYMPQDVKVSEWTDDLEVADEETVVEFSAINEETRSNITFAVSPKTSVTPADYLEYNKLGLMSDKTSGNTYTIQEEIAKLEIAGHPFERLDIVAQNEDDVLNIQYCAGKIGDRLVIMIIFFDEGMEADATGFIEAVVKAE